MLLLIKICLILGILTGVSSIFILILRKQNILFKITYAIANSLLTIEIIGCIIMLNSLSKPSLVVQEILKTGVSNNVFAGKIIMDKDKNLGERNHQIVVNPKINEINISIWDFAKVDGDYVQLINDGKSIGDAFMISHDVRTFKVSTKNKLEVKGIEDGGGGITYALYVKETGEIYFNNAPYGGFNTYTIKKKN